MHEFNSQPILFPTEFDHDFEMAFEQAERLAFDNNSPLIALHVCNMPDIASSGRDVPSYHESLRNRLRTLDSNRVTIERIFTVADPGPEICRIANERKCGIIFMGVANKPCSDDGCGSVYEYVHQFSPCAVVTFHLQPESVSF